MALCVFIRIAVIENQGNGTLRGGING